MEPQQDKNGLWYYDKLPAGSRRVTENDWKNKHNVLCNNTPLAIESALCDIFYCFRIINVAKDGLLPFIKAGRVYFVK